MKTFLEVGETAEYTRTIEAEDIAAFARISGDDDPVHTDPDFAARTAFVISLLALEPWLAAGIPTHDLPGTFFTVVALAVLARLVPQLSAEEHAEVDRVLTEQYSGAKNKSHNPFFLYNYLDSE